MHVHPRTSVVNPSQASHKAITNKITCVVTSDVHNGKLTRKQVDTSLVELTVHWECLETRHGRVQLLSCLAVPAPRPPYWPQNQHWIWENWCYYHPVICKSENNTLQTK